MSTRANIGILNKDGTIEAIYCHWDGYKKYPGVGYKLYHYFSDEDRIKSLIALGSLSCLDENLEWVGKNWLEDTKGTKAYHRDRGDEWEVCKPMIFSSKKEYISKMKDSWAEFIYLWENGQWYCCSANRFTLLPKSVQEVHVEKSSD